MRITYRELLGWLQEQQGGIVITGIEEVRHGGDPALRLIRAHGEPVIIRLGNHATFQDNIPNDALADIADIFGMTRNALERAILGA